MAGFEPITHIIFDLDGLLLNTEDLYYRIDSEVTAKYGKQFSKTIKQKVLGTTEFRSAEIIIEELQLPVAPEDYLQQVKKLQSERLSEVDLMPGVEKLVRHLHSNGVPIAIATSASLQSYKLKTTKHRELFSLFDHVVAASSDPDVKEGKPAPDVFLVCARRFKDQPLPSNCLVFEDAPSGVKAAVRAGMQVVMVPEDYIEKHLKAEATIVVDTLEDFKPEWFGLPPYSESTKNL